MAILQLNLKSIIILSDVPHETHRYLIESISDTPHVKTLSCSRLVSFYDSLNSSNRHILRLITNLCKSETHEIPEIEKWLVPILKELLEVKTNVLSIDDFVDNEITDFINILCALYF